MAKPTKDNWTACKDILRYLIHSREFSLVLGGKQSELLTAYADSDWGTCLETRRSTSGLIIFYHGGPIEWDTKLQSVVSLSSTEAEYYAMTRAACSIIFLRCFLNEIGEPLSRPTPLFIDNKGARDLAHNPANHQRTKHIDIKHHFIRNEIKSGKIDVLPVDTKDNLADPFTKLLPSVVFLRFLPFLLGISKK